MVNERMKKIAVISCSGVIVIVRETLKDIDVDYKLFTFKAPFLPTQGRPN